MTGQLHQQPSAEFRAGGIVAIIWTKAITVDGRAVTQHSIRIQKRYRDDRTGEWKTTSYLRPDELPKLSLVAAKAYEHIVLRQADATSPPGNTVGLEAQP